MEVYLVYGEWADWPDQATYFYGIFSSRERAEEIVSNLEKVMADKNSGEEIKIETLKMDELSDEYYSTISLFEEP